MATGIVTLVCYAGVFNDVIGVEEMASRLGVSGQDQFYSSLNELHRQGRIVVKDGFAALADLGEQIPLKACKIERTCQLIRSRRADLDRLGRSPLIRFAGISGSLAAQNPTADRNYPLDMDVFLIARNECLWLYMIRRNLGILLSPDEKEPKICANFIMDESSLEVTNKNFFTATDIRNLIPISGSDVFRKFLQANSWVDYYYPGFSSSAGPAPAGKNPSGSLINKCLYVLFLILRSMKQSSTTPLRQLSFKIDPLQSFNFNRFSNRSGGYQVFVHRKFSRLSAKWFPDLVNGVFVGKLFPDELSIAASKGSLEGVELDAEPGLMFDRKYG